MISQDDKGTLYTANNKGLLQFIGTDWKLNSSLNQSIIRSVKVIDDKICVGSYMDFSFWEVTPMENYIMPLWLTNWLLI
jgi:AraC family transcriptional regulator, chitin signaling transcriptional activator